MGTRITALPSGTPDNASYLPFDNGNTTQKFAVKNLQVFKTEISLPTASWTSSQSPYAQIVTVSGYTVTANTKVDLQADNSVFAQMEADGTTKIYVKNDNGTLYAYALGSKPSANITVQATLYEVLV